MTPELYTALTLLVIGMITVFVVLLLVTITGNLLIAAVNRFTPSRQDQSDLDPEMVAAITAAVEVVTGGKGSVQKIEKL